MSTAAAQTDSVTREELVERARQLGERVASRAQQTERERRLPDETADELRRAGLLRAFVPKAYGGYDLEFRTVIETARELAKTCTNTAWCTAILTLHNRVVSLMPREARDAVFADGPDVMVCGVFMPGGSALRVDGGYRLDGAWNFASGCDHSQFAVLSALIRTAEDSDPIGLGSFLVRREDFRIDDNWHVSGLCGTGSKRVVVEGVFVPEGWMQPLGEGRAFDGESDRERVPLPGNSVATLGLVGVAIGAAQGAIASFQERLATKLRGGPIQTAAQTVAAQLRLAESAAEVDAAELVALRDCDEMERDSAAGLLATIQKRGRYRRDAAWVIQTCAKATARLQPPAGAHGIFLDGAIQRCVRDTAAMSAHIVADWDTAGETYARTQLGLPTTDPIV